MKQSRRGKHDTRRSDVQVIPPGLSGRLATEFIQFIEYHPAKEFRRNLRKMLMEFLIRDRAMESVYLKDLLFDIDGFFDLLDVIESEAGAEVCESEKG